MPIADLQEAAQKIATFITSLNKLGGMRLKFRITAGDGARDPEGMEARQIYVELGGPDVLMVTAHNGELLRALETLAAQMLRLDSRERRLMHMACKGLEGVETASSGEGNDRFLVVYPEGKTDLPVKAPMKPRGFGRR